MYTYLKYIHDFNCNPKPIDQFGYCKLFLYWSGKVKQNLEGDWWTLGPYSSSGQITFIGTQRSTGLYRTLVKASWDGKK